jgi:hypothetical protein
VVSGVIFCYIVGVIQETELPDYFDYDPTELDAFLSQIGMFTPDQRTIFAALCQNRTAAIDYDRQLKSLNVKNPIGELDALLERLKRNGYAVVLTRTDEKGESVKHKIVLTNQHSLSYCYFRLHEELNRMFDDPRFPFPTQQELEDRNVSVFGKYLVDLEKEELSSVSFKAKAEKLAIFAVPAMKSKVVVPAGKLNELIQFSIKKVHTFLLDSNLLTAVARANGSNLNEILQRMRTKNPSSWLMVVVAVLRFYKNRDSFRQLEYDESLFQAAYILRFYLQNEVDAANRQRKEQESFESDAAAVELTVKKHPEVLIDREILTVILNGFQERHGERFDAFTSYFFDTMVTGTGGLTPIVTIAGGYIHSMNYYPRFVRGIDDIRRGLHIEYVDRMIGLLRRGSRGSGNCFADKTSFRADIKARILETDPFLGEALEKPTLFGEAVIKFMKADTKGEEGRGGQPSGTSGDLSADKKVGKDNIEKIKAILLQYVQSENMRFRSIERLCRLDVSKIFEEAFAALPLLTQIWHKLTGKYDSNKERYTSWAEKGGRSSRVGSDESGGEVQSFYGASTAGVLSSGASGRNGGSSASVQPSGRAGVSSRRQGTRSSSQKRNRRRPRGKQGPDPNAVSDKFANRRASEQYRKENAKKVYSNKEKESAWDEFGKVVK